MDEFKSAVVQRHIAKDQQMSGGELCRALVFIYHDPRTICFVATDGQVSKQIISCFILSSLLLPLCFFVSVEFKPTVAPLLLPA